MFLLLKYFIFVAGSFVPNNFYILTLHARTCYAYIFLHFDFKIYNNINSICLDI